MLIGIVSGAFNITGPLVVVYSNSRKWNNNEMKNTIVTYFIFSGLIRVLFNSIIGLITTKVLSIFTLSLPTIIIGSLIGCYYYDKVNQNLFRKPVYIVILLAGALLLIK